MAPTPDRLWNEYGDALRGVARLALGNDPGAVEVACYRTMLRAAEDLAEGVPRPRATWWPWLEGIARAVCDDLRRSGFRPDEPPDRPLPDALPLALRTRCFLRVDEERGIHALEQEGAEHPAGEAILRRRRAWRAEWERRRLRGLPVALLFPRRWRRACGRGARSTRDWCRRAETHLTPVTPTSPGVTGFLSGAPALSEMAVAVTAAVAFGVGAGPALAAAPASHDTARAIPTVPASAVASVGAETERPTPLVGDAGGAVREGPNEPPSQLQGPSPVTDPVTSPQAPTPIVTATSEAETTPVVHKSYERDFYESPGQYYATPSTRVTVDADDDGDPEANVGTPYVGMGCPEPEHRGVVTGATCPALEQSGVGQ